MKLVDVLGRLLVLALRKAGGSAARFCVAAAAVASLAGERRAAAATASHASGWLEGSSGATTALRLRSDGGQHLARLHGWLACTVFFSCLSACSHSLPPNPRACLPACLPSESCLASQTVGSTRHGSSPDVDRVLGVLAGELGGLVEASLPAAERCAVIEALLYLQVGLEDGPGVLGGDVGGWVATIAGTGIAGWVW